MWFCCESVGVANCGTVVDRFAALLQARDIKAGDVVGVFTINSPEMVVAIYALSKLGAVSALLNTSLRGMHKIYTVIFEAFTDTGWQMIHLYIVSMFLTRS